MRLPRELVADHLDVDGLAHVVPDAAHKVLVDPGLELTHPASCQLCHGAVGLSQAIGLRYSPEGGLAAALAIAVGTGAAGRTHLTLGREATGLVHGLAQVGLRDVGVGALLAGLLALVLLVLLLEAHCRGGSRW